MNDHDEYRIEHALEVWEPLEDLTPNEIKRLAKAISNADHKNWSSMELAERIAGTVRAIAAARTSQPAEAAELREALLQAMDEAQPGADHRVLADRVVELMSDSDEAMQR
jgi:hypothetical protein